MHHSLGQFSYAGRPASAAEIRCLARRVSIHSMIVPAAFDISLSVLAVSSEAAAQYQARAPDWLPDGWC
jgi:hypothetical protein